MIIIIIRVIPAAVGQQLRHGQGADSAVTRRRRSRGRRSRGRRSRGQRSWSRRSRGRRSRCGRRLPRGSWRSRRRQLCRGRRGTSGAAGAAGAAVGGPGATPPVVHQEPRHRHLGAPQRAAGGRRRRAGRDRRRRRHGALRHRRRTFWVALRL